MSIFTDEETILEIRIKGLSADEMTTEGAERAGDMVANDLDLS